MARHTIDTIKIYISPLTDGRIYVMLRLSSDSNYGWSECFFPRSRSESMISDLASCLCPFKGLNVSEALTALRPMIGKLPYTVTEAAELALLDLHGNITEKSAVELLVLKGRRPVRELLPLRLRDVDTAFDEACKFVSAGKSGIVRLRMSGNPEADRALIASIRGIAGRERLYIIADCAGCYSDALDFSVEKLGIRLIMFQTAGLDGCEDPADLKPSDWHHLREFVRPMPMIMNSSIRPARRILRGYVAGMCGYIAFCPGHTGSVFDAVELAEKQRSCGDRIITVAGYDGLCFRQWRQLSIGMSAEWIETPDLVSPFLPALSDSTVSDIGGMIGLSGLVCGFGITPDERLMTALSEQMAEL